MLEMLPQEERDAIFEPKKLINRLPSKAMNRQDTSSDPGTKSGIRSTPEFSKWQGKKEDAENEVV